MNANDSHRPSACRYHAVVSDPKWCTEVNTEHVLAIDSGPLRPIFRDLESAAAEAIGTLPTGGPIPLMLLWALDRARRFEWAPGEEIDAAVTAACRAVPTPEEWLHEYGVSCLGQDATRRVPADSPEALSLRVRSGSR